MCMKTTFQPEQSQTVTGMPIPVYHDLGQELEERRNRSTACDGMACWCLSHSSWRSQFRLDHLLECFFLKCEFFSWKENSYCSLWTWYKHMWWHWFMYTTEEELPYHTRRKIRVNTGYVINTSADPGGRTRRAPQKDPILSFRHTTFTKCSRLGVHAPPTRSTPPYGKSWIRHCNKTKHALI